MSNAEAVQILMTAIDEIKWHYHPETAAAISHAIDVIVKSEADGCAGCAFIDVEEWEMPCNKCKRGCRDYWRREAT